MRRSESEHRGERIELRERIRRFESETERREAVFRLAEIDRGIHAEIYANPARG